MRTLLSVASMVSVLAAVCGLPAIAMNSGPAGITAVTVPCRDLLSMEVACASQYGQAAHPCQSSELLRATQAGAIVAPSPGAFVLPSVVGTGRNFAIDATGISADSSGPVCLVLTAPAGQPTSLDVGNRNSQLPVLCCSTFGDQLFSDGFEADGGSP